MDQPAETRIATFAGGCFWCMVPPFENLEGVSSVVSGYAGGSMENPTYEQVSSGATAHVEAVQITYDPALISYDQLLEIFWRQIDPTDAGGSFADRGPQYRSVIFFHSDDQKDRAEAAKTALDASGRFQARVATEIHPYTAFYPAEAYHQDYHEKNPLRYKMYRFGSGRDRFIQKHWQKNDEPKAHGPDDIPPATSWSRPPDEEIRNRLSKLQYHVTQENGTEHPFDNAYWDNTEAGLYVDIVSGEPLFASTDKYKSGTGWPSFTRPVAPDAVVEKADVSLFMTRTEVRSRIADSHLGHVFDDGPPPTGKRYCMNSAALRFIPAHRLAAEGYGDYKKLFSENQDKKTSATGATP
ncbi:peptide-methionine (R)-S-oxide reductase MsrB [Desulfosalsimonas sp.]|uniref:peptide-methionine (R)-S-oxide reductase MsrB n=1 Tax=Desulfosalsimonas sp. TaxID=3073848 RepID=UPI003970D826